MVVSSSLHDMKQRACHSEHDPSSLGLVRFLEPGEVGEGSPAWISCLPDLELAVWRDGDGYVVEHIAEHLRSLVERSICAGVVGPQGGVVLHSSAVLVGESAYLFVGASGSGKSTIAQKAPAPLIADDTVLIVRRDGGLRVVGTPHGQGRAAHDPTERPIGALCFLDKSPALSVRPLSAAEALPRLFPALFLPPTKHRDEEPTVPRPVVEALMGLVATTPCRHLAVPLGYRFDPGDLE